MMSFNTVELKDQLNFGLRTFQPQQKAFVDDWSRGLTTASYLGHGQCRIRLGEEAKPKNSVSLLRNRHAIAGGTSRRRASNLSIGQAAAT